MLHILHQSPARYQQSGSRWTLAKLLAAAEWLRLETEAGLWRLLRRLGIRYKRPREHVHSPDPHYVEKLRSIRVALLRAGEYGPEILFYEDEFSFYRHPSLANAYEHCGHYQPLAELGYKSNSVWRIAGLLNARTGQVIYEQGSHITVPKLLKLYQKALATFPAAETLHIVEDNWPVHAHPDLLATLAPQDFPWGIHRPANWPTEAGPKVPRLNLPIRIYFLPTYASWNNPIEKLWRLLKQEVLHLHRYEDDWQGLRLAVTNFLDQFASGSADLLRYVGLSDPTRVYQSMVLA